MTSHLKESRAWFVNNTQLREFSSFQLKSTAKETVHGTV